MNKIVRASVFFTFLMLSVLHLAGAQGISKKRDYSGFFDSYYYRGPLSITGGIGTSLYHGDLAKGFYGTPGLAFSLGANYKIWPRTVFGAEFQYLSLAAKLSDSSASSFTGTAWGINLYGRLYLIDDIIRKSPDRRSNRKVKPYITAGLGFIHYKATGTLGSASGITPVFPLGLGIEFKVSQRLQIVPEFTYTFTLNDKIDGASVKKGKDSYSMLMLKVQYSPFAAKKKKKTVSAPADPNQHREEHQEWRKKKEKPAPVQEEHLPGEEENKQELNEDGTPKEQPTEEKNQENTEKKPVEEKPVDGQ
jgi:opacity protein-like surface antigen